MAVEAVSTVELVGPVVLVAEHDGIEAGRLQRQEVLARAFDEVVGPPARCSGVPGSAPRCTMAITGLTPPKIALNLLLTARPLALA